MPVQYPFEGVGRFFLLGMDKRLLYTATSRSLPKNPFPKPPSSDLHLQKHAFQITVVDSTPGFNCKIAPKSRKNTNAKAPPKVISPKPCLGRKSPKLGTRRGAIPWELPKVAPEWEMQWRKLKTLEMDLEKCI